MKTKETSPFKDFLDKKEISRESTREQALVWWNSLISEEVQYYMERYFYNNKLPFVSKLTDREIEEIWRKEVQIPTLRNAEHNVEYLEKPNQKQFKQFDESLFKAYIDKFSDEDKLKAVLILLKCSFKKYYQLNIDNKTFNEGFVK